MLSARRDSLRLSTISVIACELWELPSLPGRDLITFRLTLLCCFLCRRELRSIGGQDHQGLRERERELRGEGCRSVLVGWLVARRGAACGPASSKATRR